MKFEDLLETTKNNIFVKNTVFLRTLCAKVVFRPGLLKTRRSHSGLEFENVHNKQRTKTILMSKSWLSFRNYQISCCHRVSSYTVITIKNKVILQTLDSGMSRNVFFSLFFSRQCLYSLLFHSVNFVYVGHQSLSARTFYKGVIF